MDSTKVAGAMEIYDRVEAGLKALGEKLEVPAAQMWEILVRQAYVEAWTQLMWVCLSGVMFVVLAHLVMKNFEVAIEIKRERGERYHNDEDDLHDAVGIVCVILLLVCVIIFLINLDDLPGRFLNPEYYALQHILDSLK